MARAFLVRTAPFSREMPGSHEWNRFVKDAHERLRSENPRATLKDAMIAAKQPYREYKDHMFSVRKVVSAGYKKKASKATGKKKEFYQQRAKSTEIAQYAGLLEDLGFDPDWEIGQQLDEEEVVEHEKVD